MEVKLEPPDGGYGWVIVFASVLNNFLMVPLIQNVVLIFKDKMLEIDMTITEMWFALNVHVSFGFLTHLLNNLLLNRFGYRKVALTGVTFVFFGLSMSSWIHNYSGFLLTFGVVTGVGVGLNTSSYTLAIKSYFVRNQDEAIGLAMTLTALGPILMPQIVNWLIQNYHSDGVILILAGIIAHGYIGAVLLQPVKKHYRKVEVQSDPTEKRPNVAESDENEAELEREALDEFVPEITTRQYQMIFPPREFITNRRFPAFRRKDSIISISYEQEHAAIMGLDSTLGGSLYSLETGPRRSSLAMQPARVLTKTTWWKSEESINLDSCYDIFDETAISQPVNEDEEKRENAQKSTENGKLDETFHFEDKFHKDLNISDLPWYKRTVYQIIDMFGLDIFMDLRYVNIMIGLSILILVEMNFIVLLPFLLFEYSLTIGEIATFLSVLGVADILFRFLAPLVGDCVQQPARILVVSVLVFIIAARTALMYISSYPTILIIAVILGCFKGLRAFFQTLIIPSYVPKERLASASAIQIISNSVMSLIGGHLIGITRTQTGSYVYCVLLVNCLHLLPIVMWSADILYKRRHWGSPKEEKRVETITGADEIY